MAYRLVEFLKSLSYFPVIISVYSKMEMGANANIALKPKKKINFEHAIRSIHYLSHFAGLWPFSIDHDSNGEIQNARIGVSNMLWSILVICLNLTLVLSTYKKLMARGDTYDNSIQFVVFNISKMSYLLIGISGIVLDVINRNRLADILRNFSAFDNEVSIFSTNSFSNSNKI